jgi:hypothetical protein
MSILLPFTGTNFLTRVGTVDTDIPLPGGYVLDPKYLFSRFGCDDSFVSDVISEGIQLPHLPSLSVQKIVDIHSRG